MSSVMAQGSPRPVKLHLKLRTGVAATDREAVFEAARRAGAIGVRPLFPESSDRELASLYTVDVDNEAAVPKLVKHLGAMKQVDFVEPEVKRKLKMK